MSFLKAAERRAVPARRLGVRPGRERLDPPLNQLAQRLLNSPLFVISRQHHPVIGKMPLPEPVQLVELLIADCPREQIAGIDRCIADIAECQDLRRVALARRFKRLLKFPLGAGYRGAAINPAVLANRGAFGKQGFRAATTRSGWWRKGD
jgi:hypothetical protein